MLYNPVCTLVGHFGSIAERRGYEEIKKTSRAAPAQDADREAGSFEFIGADGGVEVAHDEDWGFLSSRKEASHAAAGRRCAGVVPAGGAALPNQD
jgi:hypothetical protein